jgi:3-mercaptopyruvate sulfurtransferase SseA
MTLKQFLLLPIISAVVAFAVNAVSPNRIDLVGQYRELSSGNGPVVPPTAQPGDPPFIDINQAQVEFELGKTRFIDARDPAEFVCGTIPGSVNIPFEYLPEGDLGPYFDSALGSPDRNMAVVTFCSGEECDLSLHLGRNLKTYGYSNVLIFFGGWREWEKSGFEVERQRECGE